MRQSKFILQILVQALRGYRISFQLITLFSVTYSVT
jgi:hypothetical protein